MILQSLLHGRGVEGRVEGVEGRVEGDAFSTRKGGLGRAYAANMRWLILVGSLKL